MKKESSFFIPYGWTSLWVWCLIFLLASLGYSREIVYQGSVYDDDSVASQITVITSTNLIPSAPSTQLLHEAQQSLFQVPALAKCKKIIVFDGLDEKHKKDHRLYEQYKENVARLVASDPYFSNTELLFCKEWRHLSGAIREAIDLVKTPYVFIHQHDLVLLQEFDLNGVIASMEANPKIKYVYLGRRPNRPDDFYHAPVEREEEGPLFVPLCRSCGWSDQCHVSSVDYYKQFVLPQCGFGFMEDFLHRAIKAQGRESFGTYLYGDLFDGPYIFHTDGRMQTMPRSLGRDCH